MTALVDTGVLLAAISENDALHEICALPLDEESEILLPEVVLPELAYLLVRDVGYGPLVGFLRAVAAGDLPVVSLTSADMERAAELVEKYADAHIDFVDCAVVALAERLNITRVLTIDRRHFSLFRPRHCEMFEIVP